MEKTERLDKILAHLGYGTRTEIKKFCRKGEVWVNGAVEKDSSAKIQLDTDTVEVFGEKVPLGEAQKNHYLMLNKPAGYLSATEDEATDTVINLIGEYYAHKLFPVGRLDLDTEGLLILTDDGELAHRLTHPKWKVEKTYFAVVEGGLSPNVIEKLKQGVLLRDGYETLPAEAQILKASSESSEIMITVMEGKYHQIKRMMAALGHPVTYLKRLSMGELKLDESLELGGYRELSEDEVEYLKKITKLL